MGEMEIKGKVTARIQYGSEPPVEIVFKAESMDPRVFAHRLFIAFDKAEMAMGASLEERFPELKRQPEQQPEQQPSQEFERSSTLPPLPLVEDRTLEQRAADGDLPPPPEGAPVWPTVIVPPAGETFSNLPPPPGEELGQALDFASSLPEHEEELEHEEEPEHEAEPDAEPTVLKKLFGKKKK